MFSPWGASEIPPMTTVSSSVVTRVTSTTTGTTRMPSTTLPTSTVADDVKGGLTTMEGSSGESTQCSGRADQARCFLRSCGVKGNFIAPRYRNLSERSFLRLPNTMVGQMSTGANPERSVDVTMPMTPTGLCSGNRQPSHGAGDCQEHHRTLLWKRTSILRPMG